TATRPAAPGCGTRSPTPTGGPRDEPHHPVRRRHQPRARRRRRPDHRHGDGRDRRGTPQPHPLQPRLARLAAVLPPLGPPHPPRRVHAVAVAGLAHARPPRAETGLTPPGIERERIVPVDHHLSHAYTAYCLSPYEEATVLVVDGGGNNNDTETYSAATLDGIE